jgi:ABC-type oligopeptide transport system substrate-binding subunit
MRTQKSTFLSVLACLGLVAGVTGCSGGSSSTVTSSGSQTSSSTSSSSSSSVPITPFNGTANLAGITAAEREDLMGQMESYAMKHYMTGIPLYGDGGYQLISDRISLPVTNYIPNYGFGTLQEGNITTAMSATNEPNSAWGKYYHTETTDVANKINPMDADDTATATYAGYITSTFWGQRLKKDADGKYTSSYEWYGSYAKDDAPTAVNLDASTNTATKWQFKVRTGADTVPLKYHTKSTKTVNGVALSSFDGTGVTLDDYIFAMKALLTQSYGNYYAFQYSTDTSTIVGADDYFGATAKVGITDSAAQAAWNNVAFKKVAGTTDTIEVEFKYPCNSFYAMYRLNNNLIAPINQNFYETICGALDSENFSNDLYGKYNKDFTVTPSDSILSCGPYTIAEYDSKTNNRLVFDRNDDWPDTVIAKNNGRNIYQIPGIKVIINSAGKTDPTAIYNQYKAGACDVSGIPSAVKAEGLARPDKHWIPGTTNWALQVNSCTQDRWGQLFGPNGTIMQTPADGTYSCKPIMSNKNFLDGVFTSVNRQELAQTVSADPAFTFFSDAYESDPINHVIYNASDAHKKAVANYFPATYGYNLEASKTLFSTAIDELLAAKSYVAGTKENPTEIHVQFLYQEARQLTDEGAAEAKYVTDAFNAVGLDKGVKLVIDLANVDIYYNVYYEHCMTGQFDFAFGAISGGTLDPFNFFQILRSDNASTFTISWGADTNTCDGDIVFDGHSFSFNAVYDAVNYGPTQVVNGCEA